jgi:hypothetical protein
MAGLAWSSGVQVVEGGNRFVSPDWTGSAATPPTVLAPPSLVWNAACVVDVDSPYPANPSSSPFLHWLTRKDATTGKMIQIVPWFPMRPPRDSPPHRYQLRLYRTDGLPPASALDISNNRASFGLDGLEANWLHNPVFKFDYWSGYVNTSASSNRGGTAIVSSEFGLLPSSRQFRKQTPTNSGVLAISQTAIPRLRPRLGPGLPRRPVSLGSDLNKHTNFRW